MSGYEALRLSCRCGAELVFASTYSPYVKREREAFDVEHRVCRQAPIHPPHTAPTTVHVPDSSGQSKEATK